jgi:hypothetical protein
VRSCGDTAPAGIPAGDRRTGDKNDTGIGTTLFLARGVRRVFPRWTKEARMHIRLLSSLLLLMTVPAAIAAEDDLALVVDVEYQNRAQLQSIAARFEHPLVDDDGGAASKMRRVKIGTRLLGDPR